MLETNVFSNCAVHYHNRVPYAARVIRCLMAYLDGSQDSFRVAELAAGTGILTQTLASQGLRGYAVEPNTSMRTEALRLGNGSGSFSWSDGSVEHTGLPTASVNWVCISNAFHLVNISAALTEARRILRPSGYLTAIWLLDDPRADTFQNKAEAIIRARAPGLRNLHPPVDALMEQLAQAEGFRDCISVEAEDIEWMPPQRYLGIWRSSHFIPDALGPASWQALLAEIESQANREESLLTRWRTRSWTVRLAIAHPPEPPASSRP
jgi:SAM-dependent methyltransferase